MESQALKYPIAAVVLHPSGTFQSAGPLSGTLTYEAPDRSAFTWIPTVGEDEENKVPTFRT